jgi:hypothetical protein
MKKYTVEATYTAHVQLQVEVEDGADPMDPASWKKINDEHETDYNLADTHSAKEGWE